MLIFDGKAHFNVKKEFELLPESVKMQLSAK